MHDQTYIVPILDELESIIKGGSTNITIGIGEFTNLSSDKITHFLSLHLDLTNIKFGFEKVNGIILCIDCDYKGSPGKIFADKHSHSEVKTSCIKCNSFNTVKKSGERLIINPKLNN